MSKKHIVILGTLDTKADLLAYMKQETIKKNCTPILMDISMQDQPPFEGDVSASEIAQLAGKAIEEIRASKDREWVSNIMQVGTRKKLKQLHAEGKVDGIIAIAGWFVTAFAANVMKELPFGIPKMIICTGVRPDINKLFDLMDVAVMQSLTELSELSGLVQDVLLRGVAAVCSMAEKQPFELPSKKAIAMTEVGISGKCAEIVRRELVNAGFSVYSFHSQGKSDAVMDSFIDQGYFDGVVEIAPSGVIEELFGGNRAAGPRRLEAAGDRGLPQVIAPACINVTGANPYRKNYEQYVSRKRIVKWDEFRVSTRYNIEELTTAAKVYAEKLNKARGPVKVLIPLRGWSAMDAEGTVFYAPEEDRAFVEELRKNLKPSIDIEELDCNLNDPEFAQALVDSFKSLYKLATN